MGGNEKIVDAMGKISSVGGDLEFETELFLKRENTRDTDLGMFIDTVSSKMNNVAMALSDLNEVEADKEADSLEGKEETITFLQDILHALVEHDMGSTDPKKLHAATFLLAEVAVMILPKVESYDS